MHDLRFGERLQLELMSGPLIQSFAPFLDRGNDPNYFRARRSTKSACGTLIAAIERARNRGREEPLTSYSWICAPRLKRGHGSRPPENALPGREHLIRLRMAEETLLVFQAMSLKLEFSANSKDESDFRGARV